MTVMSPGAMSEEVRTRVVCRIFIKATPEDVWDAICPALGRPGSTVPVTGDRLVRLQLAALTAARRSGTSST